ncbi:MAG: lycopene cyclase domain-containing protein [Bacteroidota bacterium]|jgi:lycopene cyclase domain-containing protein
MKEYTVLSILSVAATVVLDRVLRTGILRKVSFWVFMSVMFGFMLIANGYLTWRPIVLYGKDHHLGIHLFTIPVEDFLYGFSFIGMSVILWEFFRKRRDQQREVGT